MANTPADAGSDTGLAGAPPPVHHQGFPPNPGRRPGPAGPPPGPPGHRARDAGGSRALASLPYLIVLAGVAAGLSVTWHGSQDVGLGTGLVGGALLAAAAARLLLPPRYTELLSSRWKASDVLAFTVLGAGVLAVALALP
jgi:Protein of unknown function (DUF3017)